MRKITNEVVWSFGFYSEHVKEKQSETSHFVNKLLGYRNEPEFFGATCKVG